MSSSYLLYLLHEEKITILYQFNTDRILLMYFNIQLYIYYKGWCNQLNSKYNYKEVTEKILESKEEFDDIEEELIHELIQGKVSKDTNVVDQSRLSFGDKMSDKISSFVGSWPFIMVSVSLIIIWVIINVSYIIKPFDPYPFILLNLFLSCIAAIQAPIIMMSQNREGDKDRIKAKNDYKVNLKSEIIIEDLHLKMDEIIKSQKFIMEKINELEKSKK